MTRTALLLVVTGMVGCKSSAPYTVPAAALNTAIAVGAAAQERASGGCFAICTNGTVCNGKTGYCEPVAPAEVPGDVVCVKDDHGELRCTRLVLKERRADGTQGTAPAPIGISPATGQAPPPPSEASPRTP